MIDIFTADDVVSRYTRAEAIDDGVLVDVSTQARAVGLRYPVAMTAAAFDRCVTWSANDARRHGEQSEIIRLARVLT
ncbi:MAG: hypothetical protein EBZ50_13900, partial [Alphaproteobacteria bacterium]|nr:hypothetical protein [Alphaproteobacteria bacterium]